MWILLYCSKFIMKIIVYFDYFGWSNLMAGLCDLFTSENFNFRLFILFLFLFLVPAASIGPVWSGQRNATLHTKRVLFNEASLNLIPCLASHSFSKFLFASVFTPFVLAISRTHTFVKIPFMMRSRVWEQSWSKIQTRWWTWKYHRQWWFNFEDEKTQLLK